MTISYRDVIIITLYFILFKYICTLIYRQYENNEKCNDEIYQLAKDQTLVKKLKKTKDLGFIYIYIDLSGIFSSVPTHRLIRIKT